MKNLGFYYRAKLGETKYRFFEKKSTPILEKRKPKTAELTHFGGYFLIFSLLYCQYFWRTSRFNILEITTELYCNL